MRQASLLSYGAFVGTRDERRVSCGNPRRREADLHRPWHGHPPPRPGHSPQGHRRALGWFAHGRGVGPPPRHDDPTPHPHPRGRVQLRVGRRANLRRGRRDRGRASGLLRPEAQGPPPRPVQHGYRARLGGGDPHTGWLRGLLRRVREDRLQTRLGGDQRRRAPQSEVEAGGALRGRLARRAYRGGQGALRHRVLVARQGAYRCYLMPLFTPSAWKGYSPKFGGRLRGSHLAKGCLSSVSWERTWKRGQHTVPDAASLPPE